MMSEPYIGEIRMFSGTYAPVGWALCHGQMLSISENSALFSLMGTTYGGDGQTTFALPDMRGRIPMHTNTAFPLGAEGGSEQATLTLGQIPAHTHTPRAAAAAGTQASLSGLIWAQTPKVYYSDGSGQTPVAMNSQTLSAEGGNQPHDNLMPSLTVSFIIALQGIFPSQD